MKNNELIDRTAKMHVWMWETCFMMTINIVYCFFSMIKAYNAKKEGKYQSAKFQGYVAAVLSILNLIYTGIVTVLVIGLTIGLYCGDRYYYHYYRNRCH